MSVGIRRSGSQQRKPNDPSEQALFEHCFSHPEKFEDFNVLGANALNKANFHYICDS
jgi:hypothetical protein